MPDRRRITTNSGLSILIVLAVFAFLTNIPFRKTVDVAVSYYQNPSVNGAETVPETISVPSPGEIAHNENYFGVGRLQTRDYKGAIDKFISATTLDPANPVYHANLGIAYEKDGQHDSAIDQLTIALKYQPEDPDLFSWLGDAYFSKEQWKDAAEAYDGAIEYGTTDSRILFNMAQAYLEIGALVRAIGAIDSAIEIKRDDPDYYITSGIIRFNFMRYEDAVEAFESAKRIDAGNPVIDEWIQHASQRMRDGNLPRTPNRTKIQPDEYSRGPDDSRRKKIDEIYRRMEILKKEFMGKDI